MICPDRDKLNGSRTGQALIWHFMSQGSCCTSVVTMGAQVISHQMIDNYLLNVASIYVISAYLKDLQESHVVLILPLLLLLFLVY